MRDIAQITIALLELYVAFGVMLVGFGYMFMGKVGGARAAQFYFGRSLRWSLRKARASIAAVLVMLWTLFVVWIARPLGRGVMRGLRAVFRRRPRSLGAGR